MKLSNYDIATDTETIRDYSDEELATIGELEAALAAEQEERAAKEAAKTSGNQKLKDLGLTDEEIAAITS
tara:strand:+ start:502 stop:711 length:210 start_codon:yes stop_codon:yes gene_type:complete